MSLKIGSKEFSKEQTIFLAAGAALVVTLILVFIGVLPGGKRGEEKINISVWVLDEDTKIWDPILIRFENSYPDINATLEEIAPGNYENELLNALAAGRGPDVFMFNSKWLIEHGDKIAPAPSNKMTAETFSGFFPQVAEQDFVSEGRIYAMPLFVDTLALLYNRDIFDAKGVVFAPGTWKEFEEAVAKLRTFENGKMGDKAAAIGGTSASVSNAVDLVGLLMLQNGSTIVNESFTRADFGREGEAGLLQYTKFADPQSPLYTWDDSLGLSNEVFANGEVAMAFAYPSDVREIKDTNPFLDFEVSKMPQLDKSNPVNFANYWGLAVRSGSSNLSAAWDFTIFASTDKASAENYIIETGHAPALRFSINNYLNNPDIGVFAGQALTARSWPQADDDQVDTIFNDMIKDVISDGVTVEAAISSARSALTELIRG
ncbi:MAG: hypothetical protein A3G58_01455 [Candidatus Colwellbacteria bacterium RIFCSPLOWO2_12_FULL_46_17]|uniref:ABC transporter substrate-binding protein n=1 Tax=Candidatus Colwellbacteria bacterium RIFCSPLOWO2_12_FULL_46_17 TaxID=1797695 RepID=A0A1G1ZED1_9BACT|nr:MAG: hypothetical protein A3G58_01455 [Candidatus Colwellbacteria bacterium RIFCSPLOWO2_12_FULL_46_17]